MKNLDSRISVLEKQHTGTLADLTDGQLEASGSDAALEELSTRQAARGNLLDFAEITFPGYQRPVHLQALAEKLEAIERGELKRLMVFVPPRHGKSELCSVRFPAWYLGRHPQAQVIGCSYAESLALSFSWAVRETIQQGPYQRLWRHELEQAGAVRWQLEGKSDLRASYIAAGVGGSITGEGADLLVIDDPVKNAEEAESKVQREKVWNWWSMVARPRMQPDGAIVLIMSRWHSDDLAGRLLKLAHDDPEADQWEVLHLRAIEDGQALWPERYTFDDLTRTRATIGSRAFTSLYQGEPSIAEGNIVKREWWHYYSERPEFSHIVHSWDCAFKVSRTNDYSVCTVWGKTANGFYLLDVWRDKVEFPELKRVAIGLWERDRPTVVLVEDAASGQSLIQELKRDTTIPILPVKPDRDKITRTYAVTPLIEAGKVHLPEHAPWLFDYIEELSAFPTAEHDDQVDSTTQALNWLNIPVVQSKIITFDAVKFFNVDFDLH